MATTLVSVKDIETVKDHQLKLTSELLRKAQEIVRIYEELNAAQSRRLESFATAFQEQTLELIRLNEQLELCKSNKQLPPPAPSPLVQKLLQNPQPVGLIASSITQSFTQEKSKAKESAKAIVKNMGMSVREQMVLELKEKLAKRNQQQQQEQEASEAKIGTPNKLPVAPPPLNQNSSRVFQRQVDDDESIDDDDESTDDDDDDDDDDDSDVDE